MDPFFYNKMAKDKDKKKQENKQEKKSGGSKGSDKLTEDGAVPAIVEAVLGRAGTRGEITQVKAKILQGKNRGKSIRRNVRGPIKPRDVLILRETEIEARRIMKKINRGSQS
jgi:small subunit ribosomal protein S28e